MATLWHPTEYMVHLPGVWIDAKKLESILLRAGDALAGTCTSVVIRVAAGCKLMIDVVIRLLSFCNQIIATTRRLRLEFAAGDQGALGYLNRMGFFDNLNPAVEVTPARPRYSGAAIHRGGNRGLVEIERFSAHREPDHGLVDKLASTAERSCATRSDATQIRGAVFSIFSELIGNVGEHSGSRLDGFAALQTYPAGNQMRIAVSDSGMGIMASLRPALRDNGDPAADLGDVDLLVEMLRKGVSRFDDQEKRGNGLMLCARHAVRFKADLDIRLPSQRVLLKPAANQYSPNTAYYQDGLPLLWGTHISFTLNLA